MSSLSKGKLSLYAGLSRGKMRDKAGLFIVEGRKSVNDLISLFELEALISLRGIDVSESVADSSRVYEVSESEMRKISSMTTVPEVLAIFRKPEQTDEIPVPEKDKLYLLLDGVRDPGNFGTIVRTAHWFGISRIYASEDCVDIYNPKTIQSTMGSLGKIEVVYCNLVQLISDNKRMPVYGTLLEGENIYEATLKEHGFIVMGNEGKGISDEVRSLVTNPVLIPPFDKLNHSESLNVATATAAVLAIFRKNHFTEGRNASG